MPAASIFRRRWRSPRSRVCACFAHSSALRSRRSGMPRATFKTRVNNRVIECVMEIMRARAPTSASYTFIPHLSCFSAAFFCHGTVLNLRLAPFHSSGWTSSAVISRTRM